MPQARHDERRHRGISPRAAARRMSLLLLSRLGWRLLGHLGAAAVAIDERLEVRPRAELRHRGSSHLDWSTGGGVASGAGRPLALLEDTEASDGHLVAARHGRLNGLEDGVEGLGG